MTHHRATLAALAFLALASCQSPHPSEPATSAVKVAVPEPAPARAARAERATFERATPESVGLDPQALANLRDGVRSWVEADEAVGAEVLVIKDEKIVLHEAFGWKDREDRRALEPGTIFCIRSMTKPIVGTAVQMLVDEGKLDLADPASKYLPAFDNERSRAITLAQLLTHTAGFPMTLMDRPLEEYTGQRAVADQAGEIGPTYSPGSRFSYSDSDTEALGAIVALVAGEPLESFVQRRVLDPLGMRDTYPVLRDGAPDRARVSSNYLGGPGAWTKYWDDESPPFFPYFLGAAAMYSTTLDYARFLQMWMDGGVVRGERLLSPAAVARALEPAVPMLVVGGDAPYPTMFRGERVFYGQHWMVWKDEAARVGAPPAFGHGGSDGTFAWAFPEQRLMAFYFTQARGGLSVFRFEQLLGPLVGRETELAPPPAREPPSPDELASLCGAYRFEQTQSYVVASLARGRLQISFMGLTSAPPEIPDGEGWWRFAPPSKARVRFDRGPSGEVRSLRLDDGGTEIDLPRVVPEPGLPSLDELMALRRAGQGGEAFDRLATLHLEGELESGKRKGRIVAWMDGERRFSSWTELAGAAQTAIAADERAWLVPDGHDPQEIDGRVREAVRLTNPLGRMADWRHSYARVEVIERRREGERDVLAVLAQPELLPPSMKYVDAATGLIVREESWTEVAGVGTLPTSAEFEDYRAVDGVVLPFTVTRTSQLSGKLVARYTEIEVNPVVPAGTFEPAKRP